MGPKATTPEIHHAAPRVSYSVSFKGITVGGSNYHPEKVDVSMTRTIDFIDGETPEELQQRLADIDGLEAAVIASVDHSLGEKVRQIKQRIAKKLRPAQASE